MQDLKDEYLDALRVLVRCLRTAEVRHVIIGGLAVGLRGFSRPTRDINAVLWDVDDRIDEVIEELAASGFQFRPGTGRDFALLRRLLLMVSSNGIEVDLSLGIAPFELEVIERATEEDALGIMVRTARVEDLLIMKVLAGRDRDMLDVMKLSELWPTSDFLKVREVVTMFAEVLEDPSIIERLAWLPRQSME